MGFYGGRCPRLGQQRRRASGGRRGRVRPTGTTVPAIAGSMRAIVGGIGRGKRAVDGGATDDIMQSPAWVEQGSGGGRPQAARNNIQQHGTTTTNRKKKNKTGIYKLRIVELSAGPPERLAAAATPG